MNHFTIWLVVLLLAVAAAGCKKEPPQKSAYIRQVEQERAAKDADMRDAPSSPFNQEPRVPFHPLRYYPVDSSWRFTSLLTELQQKDTVIIYGTKGEPRSVLRFGFVTFKKAGNEFKMFVYKGTSRAGEPYYSLWFTDRTTGKETYGVGRYIDFELQPGSGHLYTLDFNLAYNPYCAYSSKYSCAVPTKDDFLNLSVEAGEKKFHD